MGESILANILVLKEEIPAFVGMMAVARMTKDKGMAVIEMTAVAGITER